MEDRTPGDVLKLVKDSGIDVIDVRFCDLPGLMQHFSIPAHELSEDVFEDGLRLRRFVDPRVPGDPGIRHAPDPRPEQRRSSTRSASTRRSTSTASCATRSRASRTAAIRATSSQKAESYLESTGLADTAYFGPEAEFYIFDSVRFDQNQFSGYYFVDSVEGVWNSGRERELDGSPNLAYKPRYKEGYFPVPPMDQFQDLRSEMVRVLEQVGIAIEVQHHEVGTAGQAEIDMRFDKLARDGRQVDALQVRREERRPRRRATRSRSCRSRSSWTTVRACTCTSRCGRAASRCSSTRRATPACPTWRAGTSAACSQHAPAILAFSNPTTNSYKRLVPGYEAPVNLVYSQRNRSASIRIPLYSKSPKAKRLEFRCPDPSCNPYLAFSAMLMAGLDGIQNRIEPPTPVDRTSTTSRPRSWPQVPQVPGSLNESLAALEADHEFLLKGDVFTPDVIDTWIAYKTGTRDRPRAAPPAPVGVLPLLRHLIGPRGRDVAFLLGVGYGSWWFRKSRSASTRK